MTGSRDRVLSGMRPSGQLHLGNFLGALENWVKLQDQFECFYFVANWHVLTTNPGGTAEVPRDTIEMGATIAVAMEAGLAKFGDAEAAIRLLKEVGQGTALGKVLGSGAKVTGQVFGVELLDIDDLKAVGEESLAQV